MPVIDCLRGEHMNDTQLWEKITQARTAGKFSFDYTDVTGAIHTVRLSQQGWYEGFY